MAKPIMEMIYWNNKGSSNLSKYFGHYADNNLFHKIQNLTTWEERLLRFSNKEQFQQQE